MKFIYMRERVDAEMSSHAEEPIPVHISTAVHTAKIHLLRRADKVGVALGGYLASTASRKPF
jgi:hypothetical protein